MKFTQTHSLYDPPLPLLFPFPPLIQEDWTLKASPSGVLTSPKTSAHPPSLSPSIVHSLSLVPGSLCLPHSCLFPTIFLILCWLDFISTVQFRHSTNSANIYQLMLHFTCQQCTQNRKVLNHFCVQMSKMAKKSPFCTDLHKWLKKAVFCYQTSSWRCHFAHIRSE